MSTSVEVSEPSYINIDEYMKKARWNCFFCIIHCIMTAKFRAFFTDKLVSYRLYDLPQMEKLKKWRSS
jgi:hypothetical protein